MSEGRGILASVSIDVTARLARLRGRKEWAFFSVLPKAHRSLAITWWALLTLRAVLPAGFAIVNRPKLLRAKIANRIVGVRRVKPWLSFKQIAKPVSSKPAITTIKNRERGATRSHCGPSPSGDQLINQMTIASAAPASTSTT